MSVPMQPTEAWAVVLPDGDLASLELSNNQTSARADTLRYDDARVARVLISEGWRPIAEAPKDGTFLLLWIPTATGARWSIGYWNAKRGEPCWWEPYTMRVKPTHFMPLPAPPVEAALEVKW